MKGVALAVGKDKCPAEFRQEPSVKNPTSLLQ